MKIDNSQLQCFKTCPRKYYNRFILKLKKIAYDERDLHQDFGHCIHKALEMYYKTKDIEAVKQWFKNNFMGIESEKVKTPANGLKLLDEYYFYSFNNQSDISDSKLEVLDIEKVDSIKIDNIEYIVKIDLIVRANSGIYVLDHKTTKSIPYNYFYQFDPNSQVTGYCYYVKQKYGQCSGCIVNALSMGYREKAYKGEPAGFWLKPVRDIINRTNEQYEDFKVNLIQWVDRLKQAYDTNIWPKNEGACHSFKGCGFKELCISCDDEQIKNTLYEVYNPLEYLEEEKEVESGV